MRLLKKRKLKKKSKKRKINNLFIPVLLWQRKLNKKMYV
jgi:hypothetical protein